VRSISILLTTVLIGCAMTPRAVYQLAPTPIGSPSMTAQQASAVCEPQARYAGQMAEASVTAQYTARQNEVSGLRCNTTRGNGVYDSDCSVQRRGYASVYEGMMQGQDQSSARNSAEVATFRHCMAEHGWAFESRCTQNCGDSFVDRPSNPTANSKSDGQACQRSEECKGLCKAGVCKTPW
jgi:hypothetical protein